MHGRLQPFRCADLALVTKMTPPRPVPLTPHQLDGAFNLPLIWIARLDHRYRHAVRTKDHVDVGGTIERGQRVVDGFHKRADVPGVFMKLHDCVYTWIPTVRMKPAVPLIQAAAGGSARILRIERQ